MTLSSIWSVKVHVFFKVIFYLSVELYGFFPLDFIPQGRICGRRGSPLNKTVEVQYHKKNQVP